MKLRNKKTGEIVVFGEGIVDLNIIGCKNVAEMIEAGWTDYEEPKEYWFIDYDGGIIPFPKMKDTATDKLMKQIGNYFETKEEAEKAVRKLEAWKRLKDKGFEAVSSSICGSEFVANFKLVDKEDYSQSMDDFDCILELEGGEE